MQVSPSPKVRDDFTLYAGDRPDNEGPLEYKSHDMTFLNASIPALSSERCVEEHGSSERSLDACDYGSAKE